MLCETLSLHALSLALMVASCCATSMTTAVSLTNSCSFLIARDALERERLSAAGDGSVEVEDDVADRDLDSVESLAAI